jgi:hypothetical protein
VSSGGARRRARSRAPGHNSRRGEHLCVTREAAKLAGAVATAETRRRSRTAQRRGSVKAAKSGEVSRALWSTGSTTSDAGLHLTSLRGSWATSRRRGGGGGGESTAAARVPGSGGARCRRLGWLGWRTLGARTALNSAGEDPLTCGPRVGVVHSSDSVAAEESGSGTTPG